MGISGGDIAVRLREAVDLARGLLRGERVAHDGAIYRWNENAYLRFRPARTEIPIAITAIGDAILELSGEIRDGSHPMVTPPNRPT